MGNEEYLKQFIEAYIETAIWTDIKDVPPEASTVLLETCPWCTSGRHEVCGESVNSPKIYKEWAQDCSRRTVTKVCEDFITANWNDLQDLHPERAGTDFWLAKNGFDAGFWSRRGDQRDNRLNMEAKAHGSSYAEYDEDRHVIHISE